MRIGIISDIHGNLEAAQSSFLFLGDKTDFIAVTGDVVGYGPDPEECVQLVMEKAGIVLRGNHEEGIITGDFSRFKETARIALEWTVSRISASCKSKLESFPEKDARENCLFVHASVSDPVFKYLLRIEDACTEFGILDKKICFFGHTHMPGGFRKKTDGSAEVIRPDFSGRLEVDIEEGCSYLINVGSAGQPRDGFPFACAAIYDTEKNTVVLHRIEYPLEITRKKIIERGLPSVLARRIIQAI
jgi:predicted phosphodiesterase